MRSLLLSVALIGVLFSASPAQAAKSSHRGGGGDVGGDLTDNPWSVGLQIGLTAIAFDNNTVAAFAMEIPFEYTFKLGIGEFAPHVSFMLGAAKGGFISMAIPLGFRYKFRVLKQAPLYVYPFFDIGPAFDKDGNTSGVLRVGAGLSYLVHPNVELIFQPLGLGACFTKDAGQFMYNFLVGANFRF